MLIDESVRNPVSGRVADLRIDSWTESKVSSPECILPLLVESTGSNPEQKIFAQRGVHARPGPSRSGPGLRYSLLRTAPAGLHK
jgi:hypothetical protein